MKRVYTVKERLNKDSTLFAWQKSNGNYLATSGRDQVVHIYNRYGEPKDNINLPGVCVGLQWDKDGDILAAICDQSPMIYIWNSNTGRSATIDTGLRDTLSILLWSKGAPVLAVATSKGNLLIYNHQTSRKVPILGKHSKRITCGAWSQQNLLALGSNDRTLTVSNLDGDNVRHCVIRGEISLIQFSEMKQDEKSSGQNTISLIIDKEAMYLYNIYDPDNPIELTFQAKYGKICDYQWYGDGYIAIGFHLGYFIVISTHMKEIGQELFQVRNHKDYLSAVAVSATIQKAVSIGDNSVRVHELQDFESIYAIVTLDDESRLNCVDWTDDGQLMAVSTNKGNIHVYLTKLPILGDICGTNLAYLTSLLEISIYDKLNAETVLSLKTEIEPGFIAIGPYHLAFGMNNCAWIYEYDHTGFQLFAEKEYLGTVEQMRLNAEYAAVLFEGRIQVHGIQGTFDEQHDKSAIFPQEQLDHSNGAAGAQHNSAEDPYKITAFSLCEQFLIYSTDHGAIYFFYLEDWAFVNEYRHDCAIKSLYPDSTSCRLIFIDEKMDGHIYNPINDMTLAIPDLPASLSHIIWESHEADKHIFIIHDSDNLYTYVYQAQTIQGARVNKVSKTKLGPGQVPKMLYAGEVLCQTQSSKITTLTLGSHGSRHKLADLQKCELKDLLQKDIELARFESAWLICQMLQDHGHERDDHDQSECWQMLAKAAVFNLQLDFAIKVYRKIKDVGSVWSLNSFKNTEDNSLLSGYLAMFLGDFSLAQDMFLSSSSPMSALEMRRDLLHWDQALQLANKLSPEQIPFISREYAMQLEFVGDYPNALMHYDKGVTDSFENVDHDNVCKGGIARMSIRCGDIQRGTQLAAQMNSRMLKRECADILENMKQYSEAAALYQSANYYDKAASLHIRLKNWNDVKSLLANVTSHKIFGQYAKAKEAERNYNEAANAYRLAQDYDNLIRILVDNLNEPEEAVKVVQECNSVEGAKMVAKFFQKLNDYRSAIKFLVMSKCNDEAFQMAQTHNIMDVYAEVIGDTAHATPDNYTSIAVHFQNKRNHLLAGKFYHLASSHTKAMKYLLKAAACEDHQAMQLAVDTAGAANDPQLTVQLIDFLMGEHDGVPKDFKYLFRLYMTMKQYKEAAKTAIIIAREEQNSGNYRNSHDLLFSMYQELRKNNIKIPSEMNVNLMILHSYLLVRIHVKRGDHLNGARMLIRVANNISKFPSHIVPILTSTVIECHRSGLKNSSFSYAAMLMRPEYRSQIDLKYKKKIEAIVRKPTKTEEDEAMSECPYCNYSLADSQLFCPQCKNSIAYCIASGRHLIKQDLTICPHCKFPAILSHFTKLLESEQNCPMCSEKLEASMLSLVATNEMDAILHENDIE